ncbi:hypothetical protein BC829DRAFT_406068 [Chytridium lagenaria]|nr:hypothetical protein BC829DRAFT_406068 [Chytridium lagenaria]
MSRINEDPDLVNIASNYAHLVGRRIADIPREQLPTVHRVLQEGGMFTMDYRPERVNFHTRNDVITSVSSG